MACLGFELGPARSLWLQGDGAAQSLAKVMQIYLLKFLLTRVPDGKRVLAAADKFEFKSPTFSNFP